MKAKAITRKTITRNLRDQVGRVAKIIFRKEINRKHAVVAYYNFKAVLGKLVLKGAGHQDHIGITQKTRYRSGDVLHEHYRANGFYGISQVLNEYSGYKGKICACIEHGLYFGEYYNPIECINSGLPGVITFGSSRAQILKRKGNVRVYEVGPYILYAAPDESTVSAIYEQTKGRRTLLVFPAHSTDGASVQFSIERSLQTIEDMKAQHGFECVIVNLYYRDAASGIVEKYSDAGHCVTCAGHINDPLFLPRLRAIISCADMTMSNNVGTHIGYAIALGKPHVVVQDKIDYSLSCRADSAVVEMNCHQEDMGKIRAAFSEYRECISREQIEMGNYYWGLNKHLTQNGLLNVLRSCEALMEKNPTLNEGNAVL